eukprot:scaffold2090_cov103-Cylindrotheca_fusiformis.AAC.5
MKQKDALQESMVRTFYGIHFASRLLASFAILVPNRTYDIGTVQIRLFDRRRAGFSPFLRNIKLGTSGHGLLRSHVGVAEAIKRRQRVGRREALIEALRISFACYTHIAIEYFALCNEF